MSKVPTSACSSMRSPGCSFTMTLSRWRGSRMRLRMMPEGQYRLIDPGTGRYVNGRQGRPFEFDLDSDSLHGALRRALPDMIRPRR